MQKGKIKQALKEAGLTQNDLAKKMNITQPTVNSFVNGRRNPTVKTLKKIAKATGKDMNYFFDKNISQTVNNSKNINQTINQADMEFIKENFKILNAKLDLLLKLNRRK